VTQDALNREALIDQLRDALTHLYNADHLRTSALIDLFGLSNKFDASSALRKILVDGIESFKPSPDEPDQSRAWRIYDSLFCCYVQQLSQQVVADQLSISDRQLRREQRAAIEELTDLLWKRYNLEEKIMGASADESSETVLNRELAWVRQSTPENPANLKEQITEVLNLSYPLSTQIYVDLKCELPEDLPDLALHPVALNQILLNLVLEAIHRTPGGLVKITAHRQTWSVHLLIETFHPQRSLLHAESESPGNLQVAQQMVQLSGAQLQFIADKTHLFSAHLRLPTREELPILAVDDNADALQLMQRFAAGSRYRVYTTQEPDQVLPLIEKYRPMAILLDIMMPKDNGWMVLGRLKQHPLASELPVIICTILPQENLALTLGASGYLKKPFTREAFLDVIDRQIVSLESESGSFPE
jgi:CheY-like chemotaxis protein